MEKGKSIELKLYKAIDSLVDEMNQKYNVCAEEDINTKIQDIEFKKQLAEHIQNLVKFRKTSEKFLESEFADIMYNINIEISSNSMKTVDIKKTI